MPRAWIAVVVIGLAVPAHADECADEPATCLVATTLPPERKLEMARAIVAGLDDPTSRRALLAWVLRIDRPELRTILMDGLVESGGLTKATASLVPSEVEGTRKIRALLDAHYGKVMPRTTMDGEPARTFLSQRARLADCRIEPAGKKIRLACETRFCRSGCYRQQVRATFEVRSAKAWRLLRATESSDDSDHSCGICY